jgi:hypothetical protein
MRLLGETARAARLVGEEVVVQFPFSRVTNERVSNIVTIHRNSL